MVEIIHSFITSKAQASDTTLVSRSAWNEAHSIVMGALAVVGRAAATSGDAADISAVANTGYALRESGAQLGFGTLGSSGIADSALTSTKYAQSSIPSAALGFNTQPILSASNLVLGRYTAGSGFGEELSLSGLDLSGSVLRRAAFIGDVFGNPGSSLLTISQKSVSFAKIQDLAASNTLLGRFTAGSGSIEELAISGFDFSGSIFRRAAFVGDVTALAGSSTLTISSGAVSYEKIQPLSSSDRILGRFTAGVGSVEELQLVTGRRGLVLSGSNLVGDSLAGDLTAPLGSSTVSVAVSAIGSTKISANAILTGHISNNQVSYAKIQQLSASQKILGRHTVGIGSVEEITIHNALDWLATTIGDILVKATSNTWTVVPGGTSGHVLSAQGAGATPKYVAGGAGGGDFTLIDSRAVSGISLVDFETGFDDTYDAYEMRFTTIKPTSDDVQLLVLAKVRGSYAISGYVTAGTRVTQTGGANFNSTSGIVLTVGEGGGIAAGNASGESLTGVLRFGNVENSIHKVMFEGNTGYIQSDAEIASVRMTGCWDTAASSVTGLRIKYNAGLLNHGRISLYGLTK